MDRIAAGIRFLAFLVGAAGTLCLFAIPRPASISLADHLDFFLVQAFASPLPLIAASVALAAALAARVIEALPLRPAPLGRAADATPTDPPASAGATPRLSPAHRPQLERLRARLAGTSHDLVAFIDRVLEGAAEVDASDIHIEPRTDATHVLLRVEGILAEIFLLSSAHHQQLIRRLKVMADLVPYQTEKPQDGRFQITGLEPAVDVRLSVVPTHHGEKAVLRLLRSTALLSLDRLGMSSTTLERQRQLLQNPQGLLIVTGPAGSGKTTTLYASLTEIHQHRGDTANLATLEDPIEVDLPFLSQTQVSYHVHLSFAEGLRAILRQDPNVLMVGEIRDRESARIAVEAGLTGHLILSTLHADSAAGVANRLIDAGAEPFLVASASIGYLAQRLLPALCAECRRPARLGRADKVALVRLGINGGEYFRPGGCTRCDHSGFRGRQAIFELLVMTPELRQKVMAKVSTAELAEAAVAQGMTPLAHAAVTAAAAGRVSLEEALRLAQ